VSAVRDRADVTAPCAYGGAMGELRVVVVGACGEGRKGGGD